MKIIRRKTEQEIQNESGKSFKLMKVKDLPDWKKDMWWHCWLCKTLFQADDSILFNGEEHRCPNQRGILYKRQCFYSLCHGEPDYFRKKYHIDEAKQKVSTKLEVTLIIPIESDVPFSQWKDFFGDEAENMLREKILKHIATYCNGKEVQKVVSKIAKMETKG